MYEKELIRLITVRKDFFTHFELSQLLGLGKSEKSTWKTTDQSELDWSLKCPRHTESIAVLKLRI